jgi:magnesium chelatase family protein
MNRYRKKISGPIIDRIDLWMQVEHIDYEKLTNTHQVIEPSIVVKKRIEQARLVQKKRFSSSTKLNAHMNAEDIRSLYLSGEVQKILQESSSLFKLSHRSFHRIIKLARTIADLEGDESIETSHVLEAFQYRSRQ